MCYTIPGKVIGLKGRIAVVDYFGESKNVLNEFINAQKGDYVYAEGGIIVDKIPEEEAVEILKFWKGKFFELKKIDEELARQNNFSGSGNISGILKKVILKKELSRKELLKLLKLKDKNDLKQLYQTANKMRQMGHGNACCVHGIIEFSNYCKNDCSYCGIKKGRETGRFRMDIDKIVEVAKNAVKEFGFKALVLQSGEDYWYDEEKLCEVVRKIRKLNVLIFLSIGMRDKKTYQKLYGAGARAVLLRFETSNKKIFERLRPKTSFDERIELIKYLKEIGYLVATGFLIGLPGETGEDIINNILLTKSLNADMYSFGPLIPAGGTPLENLKSPDINDVLKIISVSRFLCGDSKILISSSLEALGKGAKRQGLLAGASSLMINVTPSYYKKLYDLYPGRPDRNRSIPKSIAETVDLIYSLGRAPIDLGYN